MAYRIIVIPADPAQSNQTIEFKRKSDMKIKVILENATDCELDHAVLEIPGDVEADDFSEQIKDAIGTWVLSVGDTIKIVEV